MKIFKLDEQENKEEILGKYYIEDYDPLLGKYRAYYLNELRHRDNGPALIYFDSNGSVSKEIYYKNGKIHRIDGPAYITEEDHKYYHDGVLHRSDGPAVVRLLSDGSIDDAYMIYYIHGDLHREDGPAFINGDGNLYFYYKGEHIKCSSLKEFQQWIRIKNFR